MRIAVAALVGLLGMWQGIPAMAVELPDFTEIVARNSPTVVKILAESGREWRIGAIGKRSEI